MQKIKPQTKSDSINVIEYALPLVVLVILLLFAYAKFSLHPYQGFRLGTDGTVLRIFIEQNEKLFLTQGDQIIKIGSASWKDFQTDLKKPFFEEVRPGHQVNLLVKRNSQEISIPWVFPGPNSKETADLLISEGWLVFVFWLTGTLTLLVLRPKDELWRLMIAFNYLTALWLACGSGLSFYHIWNTAILLRMVIWVCVPVYLHLHWVYPKPIKKLPRVVVWLVYLAAFALAVAEWFQRLPINFYLLGFLISAGGSILLLILHAIFQPETRRDLRLLLLATFLSLAPAIAVGFLGAFATLPLLSGAGTIGLPFLPVTYFYASYRRRLGQSELRVNQLIAIYSFLVLLVIITAPLIVWIDTWAIPNGATAFLGVFTVVVIAMGSILGFPKFQAFLERRLMGIRLSPTHLQQIYSTRITTSTSFASLQTLIEDDILPSLLVRQFVFLQFDDHNSSTIFFAKGITEAEAPSKADVTELIAGAGTYRHPALLTKEQPCHWIRLALPLKVGEQLIGLWLFGRRDPDDIYSQLEIPTLQSLANQTAIAQSNILQTQRLKELYLINVDRHEEERLGLALELHDSVLNQIAALPMSLDIPLPPSFQENYEKLTHQVREIVSTMRPPMLNYGLKLAIEELVENLIERTKGTVNLTLEITADDGRYPQNIELYVFRIIQEASNNATRHAKAKNIHIFGCFEPDKINIKVQDDGIGFHPEENLDKLLANKHFGLAGMKERAELIGADFHIESTASTGTQISVKWNDHSAKVT